MNPLVIELNEAQMTDKFEEKKYLFQNFIKEQIADTYGDEVIIGDIAIVFEFIRTDGKGGNSVIYPKSMDVIAAKKLILTTAESLFIDDFFGDDEDGTIFPDED